MPILPKFGPPPRPRPMRQAGNAQLYQQGAWRRDSEDYRRENPVCEVCLEVFGQLTDVSPGTNAGVTDHIISSTIGGSERDRRNYMSLCKPCHYRKMGWESQKGGPLIETTENEYGELIPKDRTEIYDLWR